MYALKKLFRNQYGESCERIISPLDDNEYFLPEEKSLYEKFSDFFYYIFYDNSNSIFIKYGKIEKIKTVLGSDKTITTVFEIDKQKYVTDSIMSDKKVNDIVEFYTSQKQESKFDFAYRAIILNKKSTKKVLRNRMRNKLMSYFFNGLTVFSLYLMFKIYQINGFAFLSFFYCWLMTSVLTLTVGISQLFRERAARYEFDQKDNLRIKKYKKNKNNESFFSIDDIRRAAEKVKEKV